MKPVQVAGRKSRRNLNRPLIDNCAINHLAISARTIPGFLGKRACDGLATRDTETFAALYVSE